MSYHHLTRDDRVELGALLRAGISQAEIARQLGFHRGTIGREISRNRHVNKSGYHAGVARRSARRRRLLANQHFRKITPDGRLAWYCEAALAYGYSPEQIAGKKQFVLGETVVCHETIYQWVYRQKPELKKYLRRKGSKYRRKHGTHAREQAREEAKKRWIEQRPPVVEERSRIGDWEGDTLVGAGRSGYVASLVDRKSGYLQAAKLQRANGRTFRDATVHLLSVLPAERRHTLTLDNGVEMSEFEAIERRGGLMVYFARPYHSWERGTNENTNGLLREFFPKKSRFDHVTQADVDRAVQKLNNRPRKRLNYQSPQTVFHSRVAFRARI